MLNDFMFIFVHSIVELASDFHVDVCGLMVSLLMCVDVGPRPLLGHRRRVVTVPPVARGGVLALDLFSSEDDESELDDGSESD